MCKKVDLVLYLGSTNHASITNQRANNNDNGFESVSSMPDIGTNAPRQSHERASQGNISFQHINNILDLISSIPCRGANYPSQHPSNVAAAFSGSGNSTHPDSPHDQSSFHLDSFSGMSHHMFMMSGGAANQAGPDTNQDEFPVLVPSSDLQDDGLAFTSHAISFPGPIDLSSGTCPSYRAMYAAESMPELNLLSGSGNGSASEDSHSSGKQYTVDQLYKTTWGLTFKTTWYLQDYICMTLSVVFIIDPVRPLYTISRIVLIHCMPSKCSFNGNYVHEWIDLWCYIFMYTFLIYSSHASFAQET